MELKEKLNVGVATGNVKVLIFPTLYGTARTGKSVGFTVYDTTPKELREFIIKQLKEVKTKK